MDAIRQWWLERSRKQKIVLISLCVFLGLIALGSLSNSDHGGSPVQAATKQQTVAVAVEQLPARPVRRPRRRTFVVSDVIDGDTIRLASGRRVRLVQIDAPEATHGECYGELARADLAELLGEGSARVRLEFDPGLDKVDKYGRQLAYVFAGRNNVNLALVRRGAASVWFFNGERGKYARRLLLAARQARAAGRGLWSSCPDTAFDPTNAIAARKAPPPPPPPPPAPEPPPAAAPAASCHPSYEGACLDPNAYDYDCEGGSGNGPEYTGYVRVIGPDDFGLDADGDGVGCEA